MNEYQELRAALGISEDLTHAEAIRFASLMHADVVEYPEALNVPAFREAWMLWTQYRAERRLSKYKPIGMRAQFTKLSEIGAARAVAAIHFSIAQNYQGIYEDRQGSSAANPRAANVIGAADRYKIGPGVHGGQRTQVSEGI